MRYANGHDGAVETNACGSCWPVPHERYDQPHHFDSKGQEGQEQPMIGLGYFGLASFFHEADGSDESLPMFSILLEKLQSPE